ncbi:chemotaxis protein CheA [Sulfurimicrobium lacus]|uniref:Chemotaxis protein CheA n=1 Tax=Sulfurimicrobium lacus TaxID=2715678 RepID=A0A6F8VEU7_9PROT|nr:chemotaxis protein CheA [Sulfurimicrobium lacus]BCB27556.1 chemotaxis protein CheA [Sulfurimicrobium lacus]
MTIDMSQFYQVFFDETAEHLAQMESLLVGLDISSPNLDDLNAIFRAAHSIKGGSGTFGFTDMTEVTHILENLLDRLRKEEIPLRDEMVDAFLQAGDILKAQLDAHQNGGDVDPETIREVCERLKRLAVGESAPASPPTSPESAALELPGSSQHFEITYTPDAATATDPDRLNNLYAELGRLGQLEIIDTAGAEKKLRLATTADENEIRDIFSFIAEPDQFGIVGEVAQAPSSTTEEDDGYGFFTDDLPAVEEADPGYGFFAPMDEIQAQKEEQQGYGFFDEPPAPEPAAKVEPKPETTPPAAAKYGRRENDKVGTVASTAESSIRVSVEKVDQLINLVGELVITQAMLAQTASKVDPVVFEQLLDGMGQLERNTRDLQESVMSIRMMPISFVFSRFPRVVRELANKLNKQVELKTLGEGTELDKGLIEKLADPLTHLIRNSLDHGIEEPEQRISQGKDPKGTITLSAAHQGGNIVIEVSDDGAGLNREKILAKAAEKGLPVADNISDQDVWQLIFAPGFSTAAVVTDVSGRGVGMDVVKRNIHEMGGRVEIGSALGVGTRMTIRLPLTLAILDGMSIGVGNEVYILPLTFIVESLQPAAADIKTVAGQGRVVQVRGEYLPLIALHQVFNITPKISEPHNGILVLLETEGKKIALFVDELLGQHQVVIKSMESNYRKVPGVSGATIMGDGKVALILDIGALVHIAQS